ncbi:MAG: hypothetical protein ACUVUU_07815 [bacterium]
MRARIVVIILACLFIIPVIAEAITIEAEGFISSHDEGGVAIYVVACSGASGGYAVEGFDYVGDWIEIAFSIAQSATFIDSLRSAGLLYEESDIIATYLGAGPGSSDLTSIFHTVGKGIS